MGYVELLGISYAASSTLAQFRDAVNVSPTLSSFSSASNMSALAGRDGSGLATHTHKVSIRVDHSIATCFDPADKELYDLWAPKT